jgi:hypothetical protein
VARKPPRSKEITTQVLEGLPCATHLSLCPEPVTPRKPPALLALERVAIGWLASGSAGRVAAFFPPLFPKLLLPFLRTGSVSAVASRGMLTGVAGRGGGFVPSTGRDGALPNVCD